MRAVGNPYILEGDWQMSPAELIATGWPESINGVVVSSGVCTYSSGEVSTEIDYFVVEKALAPFVVSCQTLRSTIISKHSPVRLTISGEARSIQVYTIRLPPKIPPEIPLGCAGCPEN